jgi:hypothetical protein
MGDDAPADMSFKSNLALIKGPSHSEAMLEGAHPGFNAGSPALARPKPTRPLALGASGAQTAPTRQDNVFDSQGAGGVFVVAVSADFEVPYLPGYSPDHIKVNPTLSAAALAPDR